MIVLSAETNLANVVDISKPANHPSRLGKARSFTDHLSVGPPKVWPVKVRDFYGNIFARIRNSSDVGQPGTPVRPLLADFGQACWRSRPLCGELGS